MAADLTKKTYVIAGATSGIGRVTAGLLAGRGASLIGIGRSAERCLRAEKEIRSASPNARVKYFVCDLALQNQIQDVSVNIQSYLQSQKIVHLDGLVNAAGAFVFSYHPTPEGIEYQWALNHLAPFLLTHQLLPLLKKAPSARIITVSSGSHYRGFIHWRDVQFHRFYRGLAAYEQSKLANVLFTLELNRRLGASSSVQAFAADPGLVHTNIGLKDTPRLVRWAWKLRRSAGDPPEKPAAAIVFLLTDPSVSLSRGIYWKDCQPVQPSPRAGDLASASRLWLLSESMCCLRDSNTP